MDTILGLILSGVMLVVVVWVVGAIVGFVEWDDENSSAFTTTYTEEDINELWGDD